MVNIVLVSFARIELNGAFRFSTALLHIYWSWMCFIKHLTTDTCSDFIIWLHYIDKTKQIPQKKLSICCIKDSRRHYLNVSHYSTSIKSIVCACEPLPYFTHLPFAGTKASWKHLSRMNPIKDKTHLPYLSAHTNTSSNKHWVLSNESNWAKWRT